MNGLKICRLTVGQMHRNKKQPKKGERGGGGGGAREQEAAQEGGEGGGGGGGILLATWVVKSRQYYNYFEAKYNVESPPPLHCALEPTRPSCTQPSPLRGHFRRRY